MGDHGRRAFRCGSSLENSTMRQGSEQLNRISAGILGIALRILLYALLLFALYRGVQAAYQFGHDAFYEQSVEEPPGRDIRVTVAADMNMFRTAELLKRKGLIDNVWAFRAQALFFGLDLRAGTYVLNTSETVKEILERLNAGPETAQEGGR